MPSLRHTSAMLDSPRKPSSTMRIFSSAEYCRRVARRMSRMAFLALSFFFVIIVPLLSYDELKHSLIQTPFFVQLSLTANNYAQDLAKTHKGIYTVFSKKSKIEP